MNQQSARTSISVMAVLVAAAALAGCNTPAGSGASEDPITEDDVWSVAQQAAPSEVDPPKNLQDLVDESTLIVRGSIASIASGPERVDELPEGDVVTESTILDIEVLETLKGTAGEGVKVWMAGPAPVELHSTRPIHDTNETLWFLVPSDQEDLYLMASTMGAVGPDASGTLVTLRSPDDSLRIIDESVSTSPDAFQNAVEEALR